jgi:transposase
LLPAAGHVAVDSLRITPTLIDVKICCTDLAASCPVCCTASRRVHSRYVRVVKDLPWAGTPMRFRFSTRRFFCDEVDCNRQIFAEQLPDLAPRRARRTPRLDATLVQIGLECGGEPGRRLCGELGIVTSGDTILRRLRAMLPAQHITGTVIGVDDFAFRRGQSYGTIIVDHESGGVIDLLPDRTSAPLEAWLTGRETAPTIVTRDRSGVYAKAIAAGAPDAIQVADRWHLLANCREALVRVLDRYHPAIVEAMAKAANASEPEVALNAAISLDDKLAVADVSVVSLPAISPASPAATVSKAQQHWIDRRAMRVAKYEQVLALHQEGNSQRKITQLLKMSRTQVTKLLNADGFPERAKTPASGKQVDCYMDQLRARWAEGVRNASELTRYIRTIGYTGGSDMVRRCVTAWRTSAARDRLGGNLNQPKAPKPPRLQRPSSDRLSWLIVKDDIQRRPGESGLLAALLKICHPIRAAGEMARSFGAAVRGRDIIALTAWTEHAIKSTSPKEMNGFADGLMRNWPEVSAAVGLPWSNGRTEGHVNRLKLIKRKMYGRANLDLLRIRVVGSGP